MSIALRSLKHRHLMTLRDICFIVIGSALASMIFFYSSSSSSSRRSISIANVSSVVTSSQTIFDLPTNNDISQELSHSVRIFCFIISTKNKTEEKAKHVHATWAARCNKHVFVTVNADSGLPTLDFDLPEKRRNLFAKVQDTLIHIYENELTNYDFFLKADGDTYVVMENLRFMLLPFAPDDAYHFGCRFEHKKKRYMSGGAGYVLSRGAVRRIVENGFSKLSECAPSDRPGEDVEIGSCGAALNVTAVDTRDQKGRHRMMPFEPTLHLMPGPTPQGHINYFVYNYAQGQQSLADYIVSFHYVNSSMMHVLDNFIYKFRRVGPLDFHQFGKNQKQNNLLSVLKMKSLRTSQDQPLIVDE